MPEPKKKVKRKRKTRAKPGQAITQKVIVNIGKSGYGTKRRTGTQAKRSVQPQVIYQQQPIPLQPNYSSQLNDLRNEVRTHLSGVDKEEGRRRAIELREQYDAQMVQDELARRIAVQEGIQGTAPQTERAMTMEMMSQTDAPADDNPAERAMRAIELQMMSQNDNPAVAPAKSFVTLLEPPKPAPDNPLAPPPGPPPVGVQVARLAGVVGTPVPELAAAEKERLAAAEPDPEKAVIPITKKKKKRGPKPGSKNKPKAPPPPAEGQTSMKSFVGK